nr:helicase C-terminal domain-containing protein [Oscillatoria sp. FACHB-1406]
MRDRGKLSEWPHHLTMARLVARALQLGRSALIQTGSPRFKYGLSYLTSALLCDRAVILVAPLAVGEELLQTLIPQLQTHLNTTKEIESGDRFPEGFQGILITSPESWLHSRLENNDHFPPDIPTLIDPADDLEEWARSCLTHRLRPEDWDALMLSFSSQDEAIRNARVKLTKSFFSRPKNPYECYLLDASDRAILSALFEELGLIPSDSPWGAFAEAIGKEKTRSLWVAIDRDRGQFTLHSTPIDVSSALQPIWDKQPVVFIGGFLDSEATAPIYRAQLGLGELTCLKFSPNRQNEHIRLYLPDRLPLPNTPEFRTVLMQQTLLLSRIGLDRTQAIAILIEDVPLQAQVGTALAAEFGSLVQVEKPNIPANGILVSGWEFWRSHQNLLPTPHLLIIATLPFPSLENPLVAARVAYHKRKHQDWFRYYLLPTALRELQRAVVPLRESQGIVALLDNRVNHRSYGRQILAALEPLARINYIDRAWFDNI